MRTCGSYPIYFGITIVIVFDQLTLTYTTHVYVTTLNKKGKNQKESKEGYVKEFGEMERKEIKK